MLFLSYASGYEKRDKTLQIIQTTPVEVSCAKKFDETI